MSQLVPLAQTSFAAGEISPQLWGRTDLAKYRTGAAVLRNMFVDYRGGAVNRPGTQIVGPLPDLSGGAPGPGGPAAGDGDGDSGAPRLIPFVFNVEQAYMLEFDSRGMRVIAGGLYVTKTAKTISAVSQASPIVLTVTGHGLDLNSRFYIEDVVGCARSNGISGLNGRLFEVAAVTTNTITLKSPWNFALSSTGWSAYVSGGVIRPVLEVTGTAYAALETVPKRELNYVQSADVLTLTHPSMPPHNVKRLAEDDWTIEREAIGPKLMPPTGLAVEGANQDTQRIQYIYTYCVTAANSDTHDESAAGDPVSITMSAVRNADNETITTSRKLSWSAVDGANLYRLYKAQVVPKTTPTTPPYTWGLIGETSALSYQDLNYAPDYTRAPPTNRNPFNNGVLQSIAVVDAGFGYLNPQVTIADGGGGGSGAVANAAIDDSGAITAINVTSGGTEYTAPTATIAEANFVAGSGATIAFSGSWSVDAGVYTPAPGSITISSGGSGYHVPQITGTISGGPGTPTEGNGYGTVTHGVLSGITWLTPPATDNTSSATLTITVADQAPGWTPPHPSPANSQALAVATLGDQVNPRCVTYFQQRKAYGGGDQPTTFWMSRPGLYSNFDITYPSQDDDAITATIAGSQVNELVSFTPVSNGLIALTSGGAYLISGGQPAAPVTPSSITSLAQVSSGSALLQPVVMGSDVVYLQSRGTSVRTLSYSFQVDSYQGADVSALSGHLLEGQTIVQWAWAEEPHKLLWAVRDDGVMLSLAYIKEQEVYGWSRHDTQGQFVSVASIPEAGEDAVYAIVRRIANGGFYYMTERLASRLLGANWAQSVPADPEQAWFVDCGARYPLTRPATQLLAGTTGPAGALASASIVAGGAGYAADATARVVDPTGRGAEVSLTVSDGAVTGVSIDAAGSGYTAPRLEIAGGTQGGGAIIALGVQSLQGFITAAAVDAHTGDVLRVGGGKGIVTAVADSTHFTCNMIVPPRRHLANTPPATMAPLLAESGEWSLTTPVQTIGGLDHLEGQTVLGLADGSLVAPTTVSGGCIELERPASAVVLGLGYTSQLQTLRMDVGDPSIAGRRRLVPSVTVRAMDTRGFAIGPDFKRPGAMIEIKQRRDEGYGQPIALNAPGQDGGVVAPAAAGLPSAPSPLGYTDFFVNVTGQWNKDGYVCLQQSYPLPMAILDVIPDVVVGDERG